jgi:hypothetical protein
MKFKTDRGLSKNKPVSFRELLTFSYSRDMCWWLQVFCVQGPIDCWCILNTCCKVVPELEQFQRRCLPPDTPPLEMPIPRCYHARYTQGTDSPDSSPTPMESVLVLENLKSRGFQGADFSRGLTLRQAESALEAVARLHALSLALKVT